MNIPPRLTFLDRQVQTEDQNHEYKALQVTNNLVTASRDFYREYLSAFANSTGGCLWFGIEDNGEVRGIFLSPEQQNHLQFVFEQVCAQFVPPLAESDRSLTFVPVYTTPEQHERQKQLVVKEKNAANLNQNASLLRILTANNEPTADFETLEGKPIKRFVIVAKLQPQNEPVRTNRQGLAWVRRDAGIFELSAESVQQRLEEAQPIEQLFVSRRPLYDRLVKVMRQKIAIINLFGPPGYGKRELAKAAAQEADRRVYMFDYKRKLKEQEAEITVDNPLMIWDDPKFEKLSTDELKNKFFRSIERFNKNMTIVFLSTKNCIKELDNGKQLIALQMPPLQPAECAYLIKKQIPNLQQTPLDTDISIALAKNLYYLSCQAAKFARNVTTLGLKPSDVLRKLSMREHAVRIEFLHSQLATQLENVQLSTRQQIADLALWEQEVRGEKDVMEQLSQQGLLYKHIDKQGSKYYHYEAIRKYCVDDVARPRVEAQIHRVLAYFCDQLERAVKNHDHQQLVIALVDQQPSIVYLCRLLIVIMRHEHPYLKKIGLHYAQRLSISLTVYDGMLDIEMHRVHYDLVQVILATQNETEADPMPASIEDWYDLWMRFG